MSTPNADNFYLGAGEIFFDRWDGDGNPTGWRHLGNVESIEFNSTVERLTKRSSMSGVRAILKQAITSTEGELAMVMSEYDPKNLALGLLGTEAAFTQAADAAVAGQQLNGGRAVVFDQWYPLVGPSHPLGGLYAVVSAVNQGGALSASDYEVDQEAGMIRILSTGAGAEAVTTWTGSIPAIVSDDGKRVVQGLSDPTILGALRYKSASDQAAGPRWLIDFWRVEITPDGALSIITEEFGTFNLNAAVEEDQTKSAGERYFRMIKLGESGDDADVPAGGTI